MRKTSTEPLEDSKRSFLQSLLEVILTKLKWDEESDPEDMDEDDKEAFEALRKVTPTFSFSFPVSFPVPDRSRSPLFIGSTQFHGRCTVHRPGTGDERAEIARAEHTFGISERHAGQMARR